MKTINKKWQTIALGGAFLSAGGLAYTLHEAFTNPSEIFCGVTTITPQNKSSLLGTIPESAGIHDQMQNIYRKASQHIANGKIVTIEKLESQKTNIKGETPKPGEVYLRQDCYRVTVK